MKRILSLGNGMTAVFAFACILMVAFTPIAAIITAFLVSLIPGQGGAAYAGVNQEVWTGVLVEQFRETEDGMFLNEIPDESRWVQTSRNGANETIHLVDIGADPEVLINNSTYPIGISGQVDADISISLDKYQTKATPISDDELQYLSYDKVSKVTEKHASAVMSTKHSKALHALAPASNTATTPVIVTTGADDGTGRLMMTFKDLITLKKKYDTAKIPIKGRVIVLCADHYNDLLIEAGDKPIFSNGSLADSEGGLLSARLYGWKVYWYVDSPMYSPTLNKVSFGNIPGPTEQAASVAFYAPDMFKANGSTKNYTDPADTQTQQMMYNLRHYYIVLPKKNRAIGAIVSGTV